MKCNNCQSDMLVGAKYCSDCGTSASEEKQSPLNKKRMTKQQLIYIAAVVIGVFLGKLLGIAGFLFAIAFLLGQWLARVYLKKYSPDRKLSRYICWSNIYVWLIPILGVFVSTATFDMSVASEINKKKYKRLATIGLILSVLNFVVGLFLFK